jgi:glycerophosphoryl diester phosphodiesterase
MTPLPAPGERRGKALIVAHRGDGLAPENTRTAFRQARQAGADMIETDVQLSADGQLFLFHDDTGARTTNIGEVFPARMHEPITSFTRDELDCLDAGSYFGARFTGERIPALADVVTATDSCTAVNIEMKSPKRSPGVEQALASALREDLWKGLIAEGKVVVSSFDSRALSYFHRLAPHIRTRQLGPIPDHAAALEDAAAQVEGFVTDYGTLQPGDPERLAAAGLSLGVFTVNTPDDMAKMAGLGVDAIFTDLPGALSAVLRHAPPLPDANGIRITKVVTVPARVEHGASGHEHIVLTNTGARPVDVSGYRIQLQDAVIDRLTVGEGYSLEPGEELRIYTGAGTDSARVHHIGRAGNVLDDAGRSVALLTPDLELLDVHAY